MGRQHSSRRVSRGKRWKRPDDDRPRAGTGNPLRQRQPRLIGSRVATRPPYEDVEVPWWRAAKENA